MCFEMESGVRINVMAVAGFPFDNLLQGLLGVSIIKKHSQQEVSRLGMNLLTTSLLIFSIRVFQ